MEHDVVTRTTAPVVGVVVEVQSAATVNDEIDLENIDGDGGDVYLEEIPVIHLQQTAHRQPNNVGMMTRDTTNVDMYSARRVVLDAIDLEESDQVLEMMDESSNHKKTRMPQAVFVATTTRDMGVSLRDSTVRDLHLSGEARAEFISVLLLLPPPEARKSTVIGLKFLHDPPGTISRITEASILSNSTLRAGDQLLSVNGKHCQEMSSQSMANLILKSSRHQYVQMVFRNPMEDANAGIVQCMLMKEIPNDSLGMKMGTYPGGEIRITEINPNGIAGKSFLNVGDIILQVNGISCTDTTTTTQDDVVALLQRAPKYVNISVRAGTNTAVVLSEVMTSHSRSIHNNIQTVNRTGVGVHDVPL